VSQRTRVLFGLWVGFTVLVACRGPDDPSLDPIEPYDPLPLVDPFIATGGLAAEIASVSPGASRPFGMVLVGPDTRTSYGAPSFYHCAGYYYEDTHIDGFSHLHAHGMGVTEYGSVLVLPRAAWDDRFTSDAGRTAPFDHDYEWASPGYYAVTLQDDDTGVEIAATERGAVHQYHFADGLEGPVVLFDLGHALGDDTVSESSIEIDVGSGVLEGYQRLLGSYSGRFDGVRTWFSATVDPLPVGGGTWVGNAAPQPGVLAAADARVGAWVRLPAGTTEATLRITVSHVDAAGAEANRVAEVDGRSFVEVWAGAEQAWRDELGVVRVRGGTETERRVFHTALYHASLMPSLQTDVDGRYRGLDGEVHTADFDYYSDLSLWDTFRTLHPWYTLVRPDRQRDLVRSLVRMTEDGGWVPRWPLAHGYTHGMVGTPTDQVFAGTWLKGIDGWDAEYAFDASFAKATGPAPHAGRSGIEGYLERGYVSFEDAGTPASNTLEYTWSDHALALWAESLGRSEADVLWAQSGNWRNTWDPDAGFFRGRHSDGSFDPWEPGDAFHWASDFVEGNAWHYLWYVPFDIEGMVALQHDGDLADFLDRYETFWAEVAVEEDDFLPDDYYWHGNEPVMHYAYLGSLAGSPDSTAEAARWVMAHRYDDTTAGLDGNDDSGTLSAWYLFSGSGFFPVAGTPDYAVGSPLFERVEMDRPDGTLVIRAPGTSAAAMYVQDATLSDEPVQAAVFTHADLVSAGEMVLEMGPEPGGWLSP
jgi:predicted alpha-1,2-mannosidase